MKPNRQLSLGPLALNSPNSAVPSPANLFGNAQTAASNLVGSVDLASMVLRAGDRLGLQRKEMAAVFDVSEADFSSAFSPNRPDRNRLMKQPLPMTLARELALVLCEATGMAVAGPDAERHALADLLSKCADYIRVMQR